MVEISIIIVNYNATKELIENLHSIYETVKKISFEIIIVDNNSDDQKDLKEMLKPFKKLIFIPCKWNYGFAKANNIAMRCANGNVLLFLNPDTIVCDNAIESMYDCLMKSENITMVGPLLLKEDHSIDWCCARNFPSILSEFFYHTGLAFRFPKNKIIGHYLMTYWDHRTTREVNLISGSCMMVKKKVIKEVGYMNELFFLYGDDVEWCYRIRKSGHKILFYPNAVVIHKGGKSTTPWHDPALIISLDSMCKFFTNYHNLFKGILYRQTIFLISLARSILRVMLFRGLSKNHFNTMLWAIGAVKFAQDKQGHPKWRRAGFF